MKILIFKNFFSKREVFLNYENSKIAKIDQKVYQERKSKNQERGFGPKTTRNFNF